MYKAKTATREAAPLVLSSAKEKTDQECSTGRWTGPVLKINTYVAQNMYPEITKTILIVYIEKYIFFLSPYPKPVGEYAGTNLIGSCSLHWAYRCL